MQDFYQDGPTLKNTYQTDTYLQKYLKKHFKGPAHAALSENLNRVGEKAATIWWAFAEDAEKHQPVHVPFDAWGRRIDKIELSRGWKELEFEAAREGIVATAYERKSGPLSRVHQLALLYLFNPSSNFVSCPLAMTDGAARILELFGTPEMKANAFRNLTTRDPQKFWTSGQWMTERTGGSDVSGTSTNAKSIGGKNFELSGVKWFTSATTSPMAILLGRTEGAPEGSRGLSLFYLELRKQDGAYNGIEVLRLKDKLGSRALPTAELKLQNARAEMIGEVGEGVKRIASLLNITRVYNSICAVSHMRRILDLAWDYARRRKAFGQYLVDHPLHRQTLEELEVIYEECFELTFFVGELLGKEECGVASELEKAWLRCLTPIVKLYTAKRAVQMTAEVVESFGGAGYIEDTGIPKWYRDVIVMAIWEGTTNVLSLDFLRCLKKENAGPALLELLKSSGFTSSASPELKKQWADIEKILTLKDEDQLQRQIRVASLGLGQMLGSYLRQRI